jgi:hypothetical protein
MSQKVTLIRNDGPPLFEIITIIRTIGMANKCQKNDKNGKKSILQKPIRTIEERIVGKVK